MRIQQNYSFSDSKRKREKKRACVGNHFKSTDWLMTHFKVTDCSFSPANYVTNCLSNSEYIYVNNKPCVLCEHLKTTTWNVSYRG